MDFIITKNNLKSKKSTLYSTMDFGITSFSSLAGLETRTEKVAIQRFTYRQPSIREGDSNITINMVRPVRRIIY